MARTEAVTVRFTSKEVDVLQRNAAQKEKSRSKYIWDIVNEYWNDKENNMRGEVK